MIDLLKYAVEALEEVNAQEIKIYQMREVNPLFDYAIVATSVSNRQMDGLANHLYEKASKHGFRVVGVEGKGGGTWLLVDLGDVVVNLFSLEERKHYDLDKMWSSLPQIPIK